MKWNSKYIKKRIAYLILFACLIGAIRLSIDTYRYISFPFQHEYREAAILSLTGGDVEFESWFSSEQVPEKIYVYGFVYPWLVSITPIKDKLIAARVVSLTANILSLFIVILLAIKKSSNISLDNISILAMGALVFYHAEFETASGGFPSGLGQLFFLACIAAPLLIRNWYGLLLSAFFGILAFYTKTYFALALPLIAIYLLFFETKYRVFLLFNIATLLFLLSIISVNYYWPGYFTRCFFSHLGYEVPGNNHHLAHQTWFFIKKVGYILAGYIISLVAFFSLQPLIRIDSIKWNRPWLTSKDDVFILATIVSGLTFLFFLISMGKHVGSSNAFYLFHLFYPFVILIILRAYKMFTAIRLPILLLFCLFFFQEAIHYDDLKNLSKIKENRTELGTFLNEYDEILGTGDMTYFLYKEKKQIYDNGQSEYFKDGRNHFMGDFKITSEVLSDYQSRIMDKIDQSELDLIVINPDFGPYELAMNNLLTNYKYLGKIHVMTYMNEFDHDLYINRNIQEEINIPKALQNNP
jgi:hypothetical protein